MVDLAPLPPSGLRNEEPMSAQATGGAGPALEVIQLSKTFWGARVAGTRRRALIEAVRSVSFRTVPGGILGIVGETGSGKVYCGFDETFRRTSPVGQRRANFVVTGAMEAS